MTNTNTSSFNVTEGEKNKENRARVKMVEKWRDGENKHTGERQRFIPNYKAICPFLEISQHHRQLETHGDSQRKFKGKREIDEDRDRNRWRYLWWQGHNSSDDDTFRYCEKCERRFIVRTASPRWKTANDIRVPPSEQVCFATHLLPIRLNSWILMWWIIYSLRHKPCHTFSLYVKHSVITRDGCIYTRDSKHLTLD